MCFFMFYYLFLIFLLFFFCLGGGVFKFEIPTNFRSLCVLLPKTSAQSF